MSTKATKQRRSIGRLFFQKNIQNMLIDISRFKEEKIFEQRPVKQLKTPQMMFMSDKQLEVAKQTAFEHVRARLQMPPVLDPDSSEPKILSKDEEIVGYTKFRIMFVDISPGHSDRNRLMSVREPDGTLRSPTHSERSRLNHIFYPDEYRSVDQPKMFEPENLSKLLQRGDYVYILNRACIQFEPDDPTYVEITSKVYTHIDNMKHYDKLRSTRHFGPMSLYLAYNKSANGLLVDMITKGMKEDAIKLVKVYNACHDIQYDEHVDDQKILDDYMEQHSLSNLL